MFRRISISIACLAAAAVVSVSAASGASPAPTPPVARGAGLSPCPTLAFRGRHQLSQRNLGCGQAKRKAVYVIKRDKAPDGWNCTGKILKGYARCTQGRKVFAISPA